MHRGQAEDDRQDREVQDDRLWPLPGFAPVEYTDDRGFGKFGIEFGGPGNVLPGRLQWTWRAKRFRDATEEIMAVAEERDRIMSVVSGLIG